MEHVDQLLRHASCNVYIYMYYTYTMYTHTHTQKHMCMWVCVEKLLPFSLSSWASQVPMKIYELMYL